MQIRSTGREKYMQYYVCLPYCTSESACEVCTGSGCEWMSSAGHNSEKCRAVGFRRTGLDDESPTCQLWDGQIYCSD
jgi:hypothetical protein